MAQVITKKMTKQGRALGYNVPTAFSKLSACKDSSTASQPPPPPTWQDQAELFEGLSVIQHLSVALAAMKIYYSIYRALGDQTVHFCWWCHGIIEKVSGWRRGKDALLLWADHVGDTLTGDLILFPLRSNSNTNLKRWTSQCAQKELLGISGTNGLTKDKRLRLY